MRTYRPPDAETFSSAAQAMVQIAKETGDTVTAVFNDVEFTATPGTSVDEITTMYHEKRRQIYDAFVASPEGQRILAGTQDRTRHLQKVMDDGMVELETLDFTDLVVVINWLDGVREATERNGVNRPVHQIIAKFRAHGFEPGTEVEASIDVDGENFTYTPPRVDMGHAFNGEDEENFGRWIICWALYCLNEHGLIHRRFHEWAGEWRKKFRHDVS